MKVVDLSQKISQDMPVFPGTEPPILKLANSVKEHGFKEHLLTMYSHTGTHIDAPSHMEVKGKNLDEMDINTFCGMALMIDVRDLASGRIGLDRIQPFEDDLKNVDFVIFRTGWEKYWGTPEYYGDFPTPSLEAARYLTAFNLKGIGIDAISIDPMEDHGFSVHHEIFNSGMISIENLAHLGEIGELKFLFSVFPLKTVDADGSPVRAVAYL